jgi:hypothetical protein
LSAAATTEARALPTQKTQQKPQDRFLGRFDRTGFSDIPRESSCGGLSLSLRSPDDWRSRDTLRPIVDAILVPPVHDGGLGSQIRVFPKPPASEAAFAFQALP